MKAQEYNSQTTDYNNHHQDEDTNPKYFNVWFNQSYLNSLIFNFQY